MFYYTGFRKKQRGVGAIITDNNYPSASATGWQRRYFSGEIWLWQRLWE